MSKPRWFAVLAGASGLVLVAASFAPWYEVGVTSSNMWESFAVTDVFVAASALLAVAAAAYAVLAERDGWAVVVCTLAADLALVSLALLTWRAIDPPLEGRELVRAAGLWVGLVAQAGVFGFAALGIGAAPRR